MQWQCKNIDCGNTEVGGLIIRLCVGVIDKGPKIASRDELQYCRM